MPSETFTVHVIDDDEAMRHSLAFLFRTARIQAETYDSATAFLNMLPQIKAGCVVTDVRMPGLSGIDLLRRLRELNSALPVIVITGHGDVPLAVEAMKFGAVDFLEKPFDDEVLLGAVRSAIKTRSNDQDRQALKAAINDRLTLLSNRERDVLEGLVAGNPNKTIAYDLGISPRTVEIYRANVMTKMQAASLSDLVRMALIGEFLTICRWVEDDRRENSHDLRAGGVDIDVRSGHELASSQRRGRISGMEELVWLRVGGSRGTLGIRRLEQSVDGGGRNSQPGSRDSAVTRMGTDSRSLFVRGRQSRLFLRFAV